MEQEQREHLKHDVIQKFESAKKTFSHLDALPDEKEYLQLFSFLSELAFDVYLKKRYDLVPNLVETVKGYAKHESETLDKVISARNVAMTASGNAKIDAEKAFGSELRTMMNLVIEKYPDLKADKQFLQLSGTLQNIETELVQARKYYNGNCRNYNNKIQLFPTSIVARRMGLEKRQYFELDSEEERRAPSVKF